MKTPPLKALALIATAFCFASGAVAQQADSPDTAPDAETSAPAAPETGEGATPDAEAGAAEDGAEAAAPAEEAAPADEGAADGAPAEDAAPADGEDAAPAEGDETAPAEDGAAPADGDDAAPADGDAAAAEDEAAPQAARTGAEILGDLPIIGQPQQGGIGFQPAVTSLASELHWLDGFLLVIITAIALFVTGLIAWVVFRFNRKSNPNPAEFTHNSPLEVAWTVVPILILVGIGAFSLPVLFDQQRIPEGEVVVKVTGYQWYWGYEYPEEEGVEFSSYMIGAPGAATIDLLTDEEKESLPSMDNAMSPSAALQLERAGYDEDQFRLATDTSVVVPVGKTVVMQVTGGDVIHSWTIPAFGVKQDGIPGRLAQLWFRADEEGVYFGQCSELCGIAHAYMPITVKVVSEEKYAEWLEAVKAGEIETW